MKGETELTRELYHNRQHLFYGLLMLAPLALWKFEYIFMNLKDAIFLSAIICVLYEIYCLRCDVQYYGELWRSNQK